MARQAACALHKNRRFQHQIPSTMEQGICSGIAGKLVSLISTAKAVTQPGDLVVDPCLGSGTTPIVAQRTGRRGTGIGIDPLYCDTALKRLTAVMNVELILVGDGRTFTEIAEERADKEAAQ